MAIFADPQNHERKALRKDRLVGSRGGIVIHLLAVNAVNIRGRERNAAEQRGLRHLIVAVRIGWRDGALVAEVNVHPAPVYSRNFGQRFIGCARRGSTSECHGNPAFSGNCFDHQRSDALCRDIRELTRIMDLGRHAAETTPAPCVTGSKVVRPSPASAMVLALPKWLTRPCFAIACSSV